MCKWFTVRLVQSIHKTNIIKFITNYSPHCTLNIGYAEEMANTKLHGLQSDNH